MLQLQLLDYLPLIIASLIPLAAALLQPRPCCLD